MTPLRARLALLLVAAAPVSGLAAAPPGASSCSGCHAPAGARDSAVPTLDGRPAGEIVSAMEAFRQGARPATVMDRIAKGFSDAEIAAIAEWLSHTQ
jgi:cytochrome subunit of sulfide dehydrogenase